MHTPHPSPTHPLPSVHSPLSPPTLRWVRRGQVQARTNVPPERTLLELLRDDLGHTGTKEGCRSGDCGACTVVVAEASATGGLRYRAVNSCIQPAHAVQGLALWTVEDLGADPLLQPVSAEPAKSSLPVTDAADTTHAPPAPQPAARAAVRLHPVQRALVEHHASQCGFCTPGFVMSLFAAYQGLPPGQRLARDGVLAALSGNLCRCTGYRPIVDAALAMHRYPAWRADETAVLALLQQANPAHPANCAQPGDGADPVLSDSYLQPRSLHALLAARALRPQAQVVAGGTDVGLWVTKGHQRPAQWLDLTRVAELREVQTTAQGLVIGAAVTLADAFAALVADRPALSGWASRFAGLPVRNAGTLGGNVANGSPIGDSMPVLMALGARVTLMRWAGEGKPLASRELALEDLYTGYRQTALAPDELLTHIRVPHPEPPWSPPAHSVIRHTSPHPNPAPLAAAESEAVLPHGQWLRAYKLSKRFEDDISAVCLGLQLQLQHGTVTAARVGLGGVAATPVRARQTEAALVGQAWESTTVQRAAAVLMAEFAPISDMRASAAYRRQTLGALLQRSWLESLGHTATNLEHTDLATLAALTERPGDLT